MRIGFKGWGSAKELREKELGANAEGIGVRRCKETRNRRGFEATLRGSVQANTGKNSRK